MRRDNKGDDNADDTDRGPGWRSGDILRTVALGFGLYYGLKLLHAASPVVLV